MRDAATLQTRFDELFLRVMSPLRATKQIDAAALNDIKTIVDEYAVIYGQAELVPRRIVGSLLALVTQMLAEAGHAKEPAPVLAEVWDLFERFEKVFGIGA